MRFSKAAKSYSELHMAALAAAFCSGTSDSTTQAKAAGTLHILPLFSPSRLLTIFMEFLLYSSFWFQAKLSQVSKKQYSSLLLYQFVFILHRISSHSLYGISVDDKRLSPISKSMKNVNIQQDN